MNCEGVAALWRQVLMGTMWYSHGWLIEKM